MERTGPGGRGGVDFISLHHWADTVLTQAGRIKAQGKAVISQCMCACKNICVSIIAPLVGAIVESWMLMDLVIWKGG